MRGDFGSPGETIVAGKWSFRFPGPSIAGPEFRKGTGTAAEDAERRLRARVRIVRVRENFVNMMVWKIVALGRRMWKLA